MLTNLSPNSPKNFSCKVCDYTCSKKSDFNKHNLTRKHLINNSLTSKVAKGVFFECIFCNKEYKSRVGLWYHNKKCNSLITNLVIENTADAPNDAPKDKKDDKVIDFLLQESLEMKNIILEIVKNNSEMHKHMVEICKHTSITHNNNNINNHSNNKTFNLQFFLNEQCKDAMNISDFANSFELQLSDLESVGELGYVEGITKIMVDRLNSMDIYKRPIHCSDAKRETLYVKDDNKWEKEGKNNPKLRYTIKTISFRNMKLAALWSETYPESQDGESHMNDIYIRLIKESTGGNGEISDSENKIIRRIAKEIVIDKL
jgi:hypothetical protein